VNSRLHSRPAVPQASFLHPQLSTRGHKDSSLDRKRLVQTSRHSDVATFIELSPFIATDPRNRLLTSIIATLPKTSPASPLLATHTRPPRGAGESVFSFLRDPRATMRPSYASTETRMNQRCFILLALLLAVLVLAQPAPARQASTPNSGAWSGIVVYSSCNADEAFAESPECFRAAPGAKLALYDDTNRVMYGLEPQELAGGHLGDTVTVRGTLEDDTIRVASLELMSIGLAVGQKAPAFSLHDQSGQAQTLDSLKGSHGTVLLFFRSADW
jgi:hypothetical protein